MDWSLSIAFFALISAIFAIWRAEELARFFHIADNKPNKSWKKKISASKHRVSHKPDNEAILVNADQQELLFLAEFWNFANYLNNVYADTPWNFQNSGRVEVGMGAEHGVSRTIEIRYNQQQTGTIETSCIGYGNLPVHVEISLVNARHFQFYEVLGLAGTISGLICSDEELPLMRHQIHSAMFSCLWEIGPQTVGNPEFEFAFSGNAKYWLEIKDSFQT